MKLTLIFLILSCILFITSSRTDHKIDNTCQPIEESYIGVLLRYQKIAYGMTGFATNMNKPEASLNSIELTNKHINPRFSETIYDPLNRSPYSNH